MPELTQNTVEPQIAPLVLQNIELFKSLIPSLEDNRSRSLLVASDLARFKLWSGSLGAHRQSGGRSLEHRLRDASFIRNHIVSLLSDLYKSLHEATSEIKGDHVSAELDEDHDPIDDELADYFRDDEASTDSETDLILREIGHVVDCLLRLSITIRNPAPHDQFKSRAGADVVQFYEPYDVQHIREKFPFVENTLAERLGKAMSRRRQYFKYREGHAARLAQGLDVEDQKELATTIASSLPEHLKDSLEEQSSFADDLAGLDDKMSVASNTSYAPSQAELHQRRVPPIPKEYLKGPFQCPFCFMVISIDSRYEWKKHVFRDLQPYTCLSTTCSMPHQLFSRRSEWVKHMTSEHWKKWNCVFGCSEIISTAEEFRNHVETSHNQDFLLGRLDTLESLSSQQELAQIERKCPLCFDARVESAKQYGAHVGGHLEHLALFALPAIEDDSEANRSTAGGSEGGYGEAEYLVDAQGDFILDVHGNRIPLAIPPSFYTGSDVGAEDYDTPAITKTPRGGLEPSFDSAPQGQWTGVYSNPQDYAGQGYEAPGWESVPRHHLPRRLSDVITEDEENENNRPQRQEMMGEIASTDYGTGSIFSSYTRPDEDWTKIPNLAERRRIQNRIAQRNYREMLRRRLEDLEHRAGSEKGDGDQNVTKSDTEPQ